MKAIWRGVACAVVDDDGDGVVIEFGPAGSTPASHYARYSDLDLILDPTDDEWVLALRQYPLNRDHGTVDGPQAGRD